MCGPRFRHWIISRTFMQSITRPFTNLTLGEQCISRVRSERGTRLRTGTAAIAMRGTYRDRNLKILTGRKRERGGGGLRFWRTEEISVRRNESNGRTSEPRVRDAAPSRNASRLARHCGLFASSRIPPKVTSWRAAPAFPFSRKRKYSRQREI